MGGRKRPKSVRKARARALSRQERTYSKDPHTFIFSRPGVGNLVKQLALDLRGVFEPFTASRLKVHRHNVLKDFVAIAGPLHVTHLLYFTHPNAEKRYQKRCHQLAKKATEQQPTEEDGQTTTDPNSGPNCSPCISGGGVYLHVLRVPHGPSLTFSVAEYSLQRDILTLIRRTFDSSQFTTPPLLAMTGFGSLLPDQPGKLNSSSGPPSPHLRLLVDMFQNMLPTLNVQKLKLSTVRRVLLLSREVDVSTTLSSGSPDDVIYVRHYCIRTENRDISRALRRLSMGGSRWSRKRRRLATAAGGGNNAPETAGLGPGGSGKSSGVPNLAKYTCMDDFLTKTGMLSDSCLSDALSDLEEVELPQSVKLPRTPSNQTSEAGKLKAAASSAAQTHGLKHLGTARKATVRLTEIGPRLTLRLIKIEEGLNTGTVLFHRWQSRSPLEVANQEEHLRQKEAIRASRRAEHEARRAANEAAREAHRQACLAGMKRKEVAGEPSGGDKPTTTFRSPKVLKSKAKAVRPPRLVARKPDRKRKP